MTMTENYVEARNSVLSGEVASRRLSGPVKYAYGAVVIVGAVLFFTVGWGYISAGVVAALLLLTVSVTTPLGNQKPIGERWAHRVREYGFPYLTKGRRGIGEHVYFNVLHPDAADEDLNPGWQIPTPLGRCMVVDLTGTGLDKMFILRISNPGEPTFYAVLLAVQGSGSAIRSPAEMNQAAERYGNLLNELAKRTSFVRGGQSIHRSVPADITEHLEWYQEELVRVRVRDGADERLDMLVDSYGQLLDEIAPNLEEHRDYLLLKFYETAEFKADAHRRAEAKGQRFEGGMAQIVLDETERVMSYMSGPGGLGNVVLLGRRRTCAVIRAMIDPNFALDRDGDVDWWSAFPSYIGGADSVEILSHADEGTGLEQLSPRWYTRVGMVPVGGIAPAPLGPEWMANVLTGVAPDAGDEEVAAMPTIRTVSVRFDLIPAARARETARKDQAQDRARQIKEAKDGKVTDGTSDVMMGASARRQADLAPGNPYHGMTYSMWFAVTGRTPDDLDRAVARFVEATSVSAITNIEWQDDRHDVALFNTLPFGLGMEVHKHVTKYA